MAYTIKTNNLPAWKRWLMALIGLTAAACTTAPQPPRHYSIPTLPLPSRNPALQSCADHAANSLRLATPARFQLLRLDAEPSLLHLYQHTMVGGQPVAAVLDGRGYAYFKKESRLVRFHCLTDKTGTPLYTFLRPE